MTRLMSIVLFVLFGASMVCAAPGKNASQPRDQRGGGARMIERMHKLADSLDLSDTQTAAVRQVFSTVPDRARTLADETANMDPRDRAQRFRELLAEVRSEIEQQLDPQQKALFAAKLNEARQEARTRRNAPADAVVAPPKEPQKQRKAAGEGRRAMPMVERLESALPQLNLSAEQKHDAEKIVTELRAAVVQARNDAKDDPQAARTAARAATEKAREKIEQILDIEQRQKLREIMLQERDSAGDRKPADKNASEMGDKSDTPMKDRPQEKMPGDSPPATSPSSSTNPTPTAPAVGILIPQGDVPAVGSAAPPFSLSDINGSDVTPPKLKGQPTILIFGSYTSPAFRDRVPAINRLKRDFAGKMNLYVIYTAEAHPAGQWDIERNRDDGITVAAHATAADRLAAAKLAAAKLDLQATVLLDSMDNATFIAYGAGPNSAFVITREAAIAAAQKWFEPHALRRAIAEIRE